jgi:uncharacterized NAD(P)/FAD-binding protein YdhS
VTSLGVVLTMSDGSVQRASSAVLALGNPLPAAVDGMASATPDARVFASAWDAEALRLKSPDERVLLIGSGLTAMDALLAFESQAHTGPLHMVSRRGRLPQAHRGQAPAVVPPSAEPPAPLRDVYRKSRERLRSTSDWREVVDGLRPVTNELWHAWSLKDRARFLRHVKVHWDSHRHRMAPEIGATLERCRRRGRFFVHAGRLRSLLPSASGLHVELVTRAQELIALEVDRVINCTGIAERYAKSRRPLVGALLSKQLARPNAMGTGFSTNADGALVDGRGQASDRLFTIGPPRYGELLETIAVPEIRAQAERLAERLGQSLVPPEPMELATHESD